MARRHVRPNPARAGMQAWEGYGPEEVGPPPTGHPGGYGAPGAPVDPATRRAILLRQNATRNPATPAPTRSPGMITPTDPYANVRRMVQGEGGVVEMWKKLMRTLQGGR